MRARARAKTFQTLAFGHQAQQMRERKESLLFCSRGKSFFFLVHDEEQPMRTHTNDVYHPLSTPRALAP